MATLSLKSVQAGQHVHAVHQHCCPPAGSGHAPMMAVPNSEQHLQFHAARLAPCMSMRGSCEGPNDGDPCPFQAAAGPVDRVLPQWTCYHSCRALAALAAVPVCRSSTAMTSSWRTHLTRLLLSRV